MKSESRWYRDITRMISTYQDALSEKEAKKLKLDLVLKIVGRVDQFSDTCGECQLIQQEMKSLVGGLGNFTQFPGREARRQYHRSVGNFLKHLQKEHKLVRPGYYMGIWSGIGFGFGAAIGVALEQLGLSAGIGTVLGIMLGLVIGRYLDKKAKQEDRVI
ncbi:hypothetical protein ACFLWN_04180 [Chloroflexota bacterium]